MKKPGAKGEVICNELKREPRLGNVKERRIWEMSGPSKSESWNSTKTNNKMNTKKVWWNIIVAAIRSINIAKSIAIPIIIGIITILRIIPWIKAIIIVELHVDGQRMDKEKKQEGNESWAAKIVHWNWVQ